MAKIADYGVFNQNANVFDPEALQQILRNQQTSAPVPARNQPLGGFMQVPQPSGAAPSAQGIEFITEQTTTPQQMNVQMNRTPNNPARVPAQPVSQTFNDPFIPQINDPVEDFLNQIPKNSNNTKDTTTNFMQSIDNIFGKVSDAVVPEAAAARPPKQEPKQSNEINLQSMFESAAEKHGVEAPLLAAIADQESGHLTGEDRIKAESPAGAKGVMQVMDEIANAYNEPIDPFNPEQNIMRGARIFKEELDRFGDIELALAAYNAGSPKVLQAIQDAGLSRNEATFDQIKEHLRPETQEYVPAVLARYDPRQQDGIDEERLKQATENIDFFADPTRIDRRGNPF